MIEQAIALHEQGRASDAEALCRKVLETAPEDPTALYVLGRILLDRGNLIAACVLFDRATTAAPGNAGLFFARGLAQGLLSRFDEAMQSFDIAIALEPKYAHAWCNRGQVLYATGQFEAAIASHDRAIALNPGLAEAFMARGAAKLLLGRFREGWPDWERRPPWPTPDFLHSCLQAKPEWTGDQDIRGKRLFVYHPSEVHGLGETIQFCRCLKLLEAAGASIVFLPQPSLIRLLSSLNPAPELLDWERAPAAFDFHIRMLSLPTALRLDETNIPAEVPYLRAEADRVQFWKARLGAHGFKIGICWQGSKPKDSRSFPVSLLHRISRIPSVRLISLQKDARVTPADGVTVEQLTDDLDAGPQRFLDTAAVMENLDLVITMDTSVAHLAGALARPVWLALAQIPDWRWMLGRSDSPWYPTMRLFRKRSRDDWTGVFSEMESALKAAIRV